LETHKSILEKNNPVYSCGVTGKSFNPEKWINMKVGIHFDNLREKHIKNGYLLCYHYRIISSKNSVNKLKNSNFYNDGRFNIDTLTNAYLPEVKDETLKIKKNKLFFNFINKTMSYKLLEQTWVDNSFSVENYRHRPNISLPGKKIALLITGELRTPYFQNLYNATSGFPIYISTYSEYYPIAKKLTKNVLIVDRDDISVNLKINQLNSHNLYQWWHLNKLLKTYKRELAKYDILLKIRSDMYFLKPISPYYFNNIDLNYFYINTDWIFYGSRQLFYKIYETYYEDILKGNYKLTNYSNFLRSVNNVKDVYFWKRISGQPNKPGLSCRIASMKDSFDPAIHSMNFPTLIKNIEDNWENINLTQTMLPRNVPFMSEADMFIRVSNHAIIKPSGLPITEILRQKVGNKFKFATRLVI